MGEWQCSSVWCVWCVWWTGERMDEGEKKTLKKTEMTTGEYIAAQVSRLYTIDLQTMYGH